MSTIKSLFDAVENNDILAVDSLIQSDTCDVNARDSDGETPLHIAVYERRIEIVKCLTEHTTCDVNTQDLDGVTSLHFSVVGSDIDIVRCLLDQTECVVNIQDRYGNTPLHKAVYNSDIEFVRCLLNQTSINVNIKNCQGYTPLHSAVLGSYIQNVRCLLDRTDCDVNVQDRKGETPLHLAILRGHTNIGNCLLERRNCDVNIQDKKGNTLLHIALQEFQIEFFICLVELGKCDFNIQDRYGNTPLHLAVKNFPCNTLVSYIIENSNCNVNLKNLAGYSPFCTTEGVRYIRLLVACQDVELIQVLIQHNVDVLTHHVNNRLQIVKSILSVNNFRSLWWFIQNGLCINSLTSSGENIAHLLAKFYIDYLYIDFSFLFDYGLDFNLINNDGNSPLMVASLLNNSPFIQFLAALPCDVKRQNHNGHTSLHLCVIGFTFIKDSVNSVVKELCAREYYPRYLACIDTLLNLGADVNMQDNGGKTVLMLACIRNDRKLLETLLLHRADVDIVDNHGRSALQYIYLTNNVYDLACFNLLLSHGCRQSFNQPCLNGNTIIQNVLQFTPLWQIDDIVNFIKFLVFKNVNLQLLTSDDGEISYGQLSLEEFSSASRHELRQLLYLSGGSFVQITQILHFEVEEDYEASLPESLREKPREQFYLFANNLSLKEICRRVIRQNRGLAIHDQIAKLLDNNILQNFIVFRDVGSKRFLLPVQLESFIDDGDYDDDYDSYDLNKENDYDNDYLMYNLALKYSRKLKDIDSMLCSLYVDNDDYDDDSDDLNMENDDFENAYKIYKDCTYLNEVSAGLKYYKSAYSRNRFFH